MSVQTIVQNLASSATPPAMGTLIASLGYAAGFGTAALFPLAAAIAVTPLALRTGRAVPEVSTQDLLDQPATSTANRRHEIPARADAALPAARPAPDGEVRLDVAKRAALSGDVAQPGSPE
ncbi:hypothetical protein [Nonomuraea turcica]|uniref:hypothetical protein n=1 Tax=Nonomuraea sp. G32 TaxID=3067274 RepID=UPI00273B09AE|nr:hypothetical protein [Nonomuraea sp. G32]MDP4510238.1 hypothetical protein [Nonomuraea sp. G32]